MTLNFKTFLREEISDEDIDKFAEHVNSECKPFLKQSKGRFLYRGINHEKEMFLNKKIRTNRKPKDMPYGLATRVDAAFNEVFGVKPRSAALFVTGAMNEAVNYGKIYVIYPIGKFDYVWSPNVRDLFNSRSLIEKLDKTEFELWVKSRYVKNKNFAEAIKSGNEICIFAKSYCGIEPECQGSPVGNLRKLSGKIK